MPPLPKLSGRDVVRAFANAGWQMVRQRGSHMILVKDGPGPPRDRQGHVDDRSYGEHVYGSGRDTAGL